MKRSALGLVQRKKATELKGGAFVMYPVPAGIFIRLVRVVWFFERI